MNKVLIFFYILSLCYCYNVTITDSLKDSLFIEYEKDLDTGHIVDKSVNASETYLTISYNPCYQDFPDKYFRGDVLLNLDNPYLNPKLMNVKNPVFK